MAQSDSERLRRFEIASSGAVSGGDLSIAGRLAAGRDIVITAPAEQRPPPFTVPLDVPDFVDRSDELADLSALFDRAAPPAAPVVVSLYGPGGVGKSALAVRLVHRVRDRFPDGVLHLSLGPEVTTCSALSEFLYLLGRPVELASESRLVSEFRTRIADLRLLVVLDNVGTVEQALPLLPVGGGSGAVLTSRVPLADLAGAELFAVRTLPQRESIQLLSRLAHVELGPANTQQATRLARMCGHLPLALRIAGAKLRTRSDWDFGTLGDRMVDETKRLDILRIGDLEVRATMMASYDDREPDEQRALRALAITEGDEFPGWILAPVLNVSYAESERLLDQLVFAQLVLVSRVDGVGQTLYRLHDLVQVLARELFERHEPAALRDEMGARLDARYLELVEQSAVALRRQGSGGNHPAPAHRPQQAAAADDFRQLGELIAGQPVRWFATNRQGILGALRRSAAREDGIDDVDRFARATLALLILTPFSDDRIHVHRLVVEAGARSGDRARLAAAQRDLGRALRDFGWYSEAAANLEQAIAIYTDLRDAKELAGTRLIYAVLLRCVGRNGDAEVLTRQCLEHFEVEEDPEWQAYAHRTLGVIHRDKSQWAESGAAFERALELFRSVGDRHREAICLVHHGSALRAQGEPAAALSRYRQAQEIFGSLGFPLWESVTLVHRAASLVDLGMEREAQVLLTESLATFGEIGDLRWVDIATYHLGRLLLHDGHIPEAIRLIEKSADRFRQLGEPYSEMLALMSLAEAQRALGQRTAMEQSLRRVVDNAEKIGNVHYQQAATRLLTAES